MNPGSPNPDDSAAGAPDDRRGSPPDEALDWMYARWGNYGPGRHARRYGHRPPAWASGPYRRPMRRPGWWPVDEPWPPTGAFPMHKIRRRFLVRFAIGAAMVFVLVVAGPVILVGALLSAAGLGGAAPGLFALGIVLLLLAAGGAVRGARRFALPFGDLIEAAGRVEAGDYTTRVVLRRRGMRELRLLVDAFNSMTARLEADEEQRRTVLADVSHELRTPLAVLRGELEAMIDGIHPADQAHLELAVAQVEMVAQLVEDLRTLALAEAGTLALHREPTDPAVLVHDVAGSFEGLAASTGARVEVAVNGDPPLLEIDPLRIRQVLANLVANALRYAPNGSAVTIGLDCPPGRVEVSVTDQGGGIDPALLPHLFERFARSEESRGSGLGLAIARRLVMAHDGTIRAELPPGGGTRIVFDLPA